MYEDADQANTNSGHGDEMTVTVDGEQYELETEFDLNKDGTNDTAIVTTDDGGQVAFTDSDKDGDADVAVELDDKGNVVGAARYDNASGEWVPVDPKTGEATGHEKPSAGAGTASSASGDNDITVDIPDEAEDMSAGAATVDMNHDGRNDTAVVQSEDGDVYAFTDANGDGEADQMTVIESDGTVSISQHTGEDEWAEVEKGHLDSQGNYVPDSQRS